MKLKFLHIILSVQSTEWQERSGVGIVKKNLHISLDECGMIW